MWYGKWTFIFVELPRRFMVTLLGLVLIPEIQMPEPLRWAGVLACLAFDLLVVSRAPDLRLKRDAVTVKLVEGGPPGFLTVREMKHRFSVVALGAAGLAAVAYYWYANGQQPVLIVQLLISGLMLGVTGYISALGVQLRAGTELPEGEKPFVVPLLSPLTKYALVRNFSYPPLAMASMLLVWATIITIPPHESGVSFTGDAIGLIYIVLFGYLGVVFCVFTMAMFLTFKKKFYTEERKL